jgi:hypothetical protein
MPTTTHPSNVRAFLRRWLGPLGLALVPLALYATYAFWSFQRYLHLTKYDLSPRLLESYQHHFALDKPVLAQYATFLSRFLQLDFGPAVHYRDATFTIRDILLPQLGQDWVLPAILLLLALVMVFVRLRPATPRLGWILGVACIAFSTPNLFNLWFRPIHLPFPVLLLLFSLQLLALGAILVWNAGPKPFGAVAIFLLALQIPFIHYFSFHEGIIKTWIMAYSPPDPLLILSVRYCIAMNAALLALLVHYLRVWREIRLGTA